MQEPFFTKPVGYCIPLSHSFSSHMSAARTKGPNPSTIADGYSLSDEREAISGPGLDFNYDDDDMVVGGRGAASDSGPHPSGMEHHLPNPDAPKLHQSHAGEHRGDYGSSGPVRITSATYLYAFCAALNSCNLGYDIGVNTNAGHLVQDYMELSDIRLELFLGSINLFAMIGSASAHYFSDRYGRRYAFLVGSWQRDMR